MRRFIAAVLLVGVGVAGCAEHPAEQASQPNGTTSAPPRDGDATREELERDLSRAAETAGDYFSEKGRALRREMDQRLKELDDDLERLQQRAVEVKEENRPRWEAAMKQLKENRDQLRSKLDELEKKAPGAWEEFQQGAERAWEELKRGYDAAARELDDPPAANKPKQP